MPILLSDVRVELMKATYTPNGGSAVDLGVTAKGSKVTIKHEVVDIAVEEFGKTPINLVGAGWDIMVELQLAATTIDLLANALASTKTTVAGPPAKYSVDLDPRAGISLPYGTLVLHPRYAGGSDVSRDWKFYKVCFVPDLSSDYVATDKLVWPCKLRALVDENVSTGKVRIATFGDPTTAVDFDASL